jgi:hypothetical protein
MDALMLSLLILLFSAQAQDPCAVRLEPSSISAEINQLRQQIAQGNHAVGPELGELFKNATHCANGPVERRDIGAMLLARGAVGLLSGELTPKAAMQQFTWAYAIAGRDVFDEIYGTEVLDAFDEATTGVLPKASINLSFTRDPRVVVVDGEVVYERGQQIVTATFHLVQWLDAKGWHSQQVILKPGQKITVGGGVQPKAEAPKSTTAKTRRPRKKRRAKKKPTSRSAGRSPKPPKIPLEGPRLHVGAHGAYGLLLARFSHETGASTGGLSLPLGQFQLRWDWTEKLGLFARGNLVPGVFSDTIPALLNQGSAGLSLGARGGDPGWTINLGFALRAMASAQGSGPETQDPFSKELALGATIDLQLRQLKRTFGVHLTGLQDGFDLGVRADLLFPEIGSTALKPSAGVILNFAHRASDANLPDQAFGTHFRLGILRSF